MSMRNVVVVSLVVGVLWGAGKLLATVAAPAAPPSQAELDAYAGQPTPDAAGWLALAKRWPAQRRFDATDITELFAVLPVPATWPELITGMQALAAGPGSDPIESRRKAGWRLAAAVLAGDVAEQREAVAAARQAGREEEDWALQQARDALIETDDDPQAVLAATQRRLVAAVLEKEPSLNLPDLVALVGEDTALPVIRSALALPFSDLSVTGRQTREVAAREALARMATLKAAPWGLVQGPAALTLYPALVAKFPAQAGPQRGQDWSRKQAEEAFLAQLIVAGRTREALDRIDQAGPRADELLSALPYRVLAEQSPQELTDALRDLLRQDPTRPLWTLYAQLAAKLGRSAELRALVSAQGGHAHTQHQLIDLLLAADEVEPALAALRAELVAPQAKPAPATPDSGPQLSAEERATAAANEKAKTALRLLRLGNALVRPDVVEEACTALTQIEASRLRNWGNDCTERTLALLAAQREALAERLLAAELSAPPLAPTQDAAKPGVLAALVRLRVATGRPQDAVTLLTSSDQWGAQDLNQIADGADAHAGIPPLAAVAGEAFAAVGRRDDARRCALLALDQEPASDAAYALLVKIDGEAALPVLAQLQRRDPLEDRPLLWQAQIHLNAKRFTEAEQLARRAVELDPSDGDQGPGDRMRARAVLAEALEHLGRVDDAKPLRTAISAIRLGEQGDVLLRVGLSTRAAEAYRASEAILDRTYCVQSRMAVTLAKLGRTEDAAVHFRRAFSLMPNAFGRRASHCFGCEGVFGGTDAQAIAEEVFTALQAKEPRNPKAAYLLGYLRQEQLRFTEAAAAYRQAIDLDPDYANAIERLLGLDGELRLPRKERQDLVLGLLRLDPAQRHQRADANQVLDLAALYRLLVAQYADLALSTGPTLALVKPTSPPGQVVPERNPNVEQRPTPGRILTENHLLQAACSLIDRGW
jgi:tetratricopeptide (TPR) repeat protein